MVRPYTADHASWFLLEFGAIYLLTKHHNGWAVDIAMSEVSDTKERSVIKDNNLMIGCSCTRVVRANFHPSSKNQADIFYVSFLCCWLLNETISSMYCPSHLAYTLRVNCIVNSSPEVSAGRQTELDRQRVCVLVAGWWVCRDVSWRDVMKWVDKHQTTTLLSSSSALHLHATSEHPTDSPQTSNVTVK